jgi:general stress protein YciG
MEEKAKNNEIGRKGGNEKGTKQVKLSLCLIN